MAYLLLNLGIVYSSYSQQQYDKQWVIGSPMSSMTFDADSVILGALPSSTLQAFFTIGSICDKNGRLLFYTNGVSVYNNLAQKMPNGDSLSAPSQYYDQVIQGGMPSNEGVIILPMPGDSNLYYIFHYTPTDTLDVADNAGYEALNLYYSVVDMRLDNGRGAVITKNVPIIQNELLSFSRLSACKHANGRDWWIIKNAWYENTYYEFLLTPQGLQGPFLQQIGPSYARLNEARAYSSFSLDGTKYASLTLGSNVILMDFDRCSGLFSNPQVIRNNSIWNGYMYNGGYSAVFSPSGRFLYVCNRLEINQYDLSSSHLNDSVRIVTLTDLTDTFQMNIMQLAPNGKIYIGTYNGGKAAIHVINQPDSFGLACDFQLYGQPVFFNDPEAIPYFPNYKLGPLLGSGCDTIPNGILSVECPYPRIEPNPASNIVTIFYPLNNNDVVYKVDLYNNLGELVLAKSGQAGMNKITIDVSGLPVGLYVVRVTSGNAIVRTSKLVVSR